MLGDASFARLSRLADDSAAALVDTGLEQLRGLVSLRSGRLLGYDAATRPDPPVDEFQMSFLPSVWLIVSSVVIGLGIPTLMRQSLKDATTIAVELCLKNGLLGMVVASSTFGVLEPSVPIIVYTSMMIPISVGMVVFYRLRERRALG